MSQATAKYDDKQARITERAYDTPEIAAQRLATGKLLALRSGEHVLDVGAGPGLLARDMAKIVGEQGRVAAVDSADSMVELANRRCGDLPQVEVTAGNAQKLTFGNESFDAVVCTQVLLYVYDLQAALDEMFRVLRPGGRLVIVETDWRGLVMNSAYPDTTEDLIRGWDAACTNPQLPPVLEPMLTSAGFRGTMVEAFPVLLTDFIPHNYAYSMSHSLAGYAVKNGVISEQQSRVWLDDLQQKQLDRSFFFCVNRFLFKTGRP